MSIASLSMYDDPVIRPTNDQLWQVWHTLFDSLSSLPISPPATLNRDMPLAEQWSHDDLFLSQTCGYPYVSKYRNQVRLVATPRYSHNGCDGHCYSSFVVTKKSTSVNLSDYKNKILAANSADSLSGLIALEITLAETGISEPFFKQCTFSGAHFNSMKLVTEGKADVCCIDAVTWALNCRFEPELTNQLKIINQTPMLPALPLITSGHRSDEFIDCLQQGLLQSLDISDAKTALDVLGISGFDNVADQEYGEILDRYALVPANLRGKIARSFR